MSKLPRLLSTWVFLALASATRMIYAFPIQTQPFCCDQLGGQHQEDMSEDDRPSSASPRSSKSIYDSISRLPRIRAAREDDESMTDQAKRMCGENETLCQGGIVILGITTVVLLALYIRHRHQKKKAQREREAKEESEKRQKQLEEDLLKAGAEKERRKLQDRKTLHEVELKLMEAGIDPKELRKSRGGDD